MFEYFVMREMVNSGERHNYDTRTKVWSCVECFLFLNSCSRSLIASLYQYFVAVCGDKVTCVSPVRHSVMRS